MNEETGKPLDIVTAVMMVEGDIETEDEAALIEAWQLLIDTGAAFQLQGSIQRQALRLIESGQCKAPN